MTDLKGELSEWFGGPIGHVHMRPDAVGSEHHHAEDVRFSIDGFLRYLERFSGAQTYSVIDTDHPYTGLLYRDISATLTPESLPAIREEVSAAHLARIRELQSRPELNGHVYSGIEVDIVSPGGELLVTDEVLSQLDLVICSLHYTFYSKATDLRSRAVRLTTAELVSAYMHAVSNLHVDVLGHPTRDIGRSNKDSAYLSEWLPLIDLMKQKGTAYELNFAHFASLREVPDFDKALITQAALRGVHFFLGLDFHNASEFGLKTSGSVITPENADQAFSAHTEKVHLQFLLKLMRVIRLLESLGITPAQVVNSSDIRFKEWLATRISA